MPGLNNPEPRPKPLTPASINTCMLSGVIPPTGAKMVPAGNTASQAFTTAGPICSAGNIFSTSAPSANAAKASVGVATPGDKNNPAAFAARNTLGSLWGMTITWPPAAFTSSTCSGVSTVPAPIRQSAGKVLRRMRILSYGSGELSGTSMTRNPAAYRTFPMAAASCGRRPRRIAIRPFCARACLSMSDLQSGLTGWVVFDQSGGNRQLPQPALGGLFGQGHPGKPAGIKGAAIAGTELSVTNKDDRRQMYAIASAPLNVGQRRQFMTDQQPGQIIRLGCGTEFAGQSEAAGTEQRRQRPDLTVRRQRHLHAPVKSLAIERRTELLGASENAVFAEHGEDFAGHEG